MLEMAASNSRWRAGLILETSGTFGSAIFSVRSGLSAILAGIIFGLIRVCDSGLIIVRQFQCYPFSHTRWDIRWATPFSVGARLSPAAGDPISPAVFNLN